MQRNPGFTLVELSFVLVIVGLIIGGITTGKALITASELRAFGSDLEQTKTAFNTFRQKYNCLPGDCTRATQFFGKNVNFCNADSGVATTPGTCNGDNSGSLSTTDHEHYESLRSLFLAEYIQGVPSPTDTLPPAVNKLFSIDAQTGNNWIYTAGPDLNVIGIGSISIDFIPNNNYFVGLIPANNPTLFGDCADMLGFDVKFDNGLPNSGLLIMTSVLGMVDADVCANNITNSYKATESAPFAAVQAIAYGM